MPQIIKDSIAFDMYPPPQEAGIEEDASYCEGQYNI
jgi:hypothetical protein